MDEVNEGSTGYLSVSLKDKTGAAALPTALSYAINDVISGSVVRATTSLTPAASFEITLTPLDNQILGGRADELKRVTITATYGVSDAFVTEHLYRVRALAVERWPEP